MKYLVRGALATALLGFAAIISTQPASAATTTSAYWNMDEPTGSTSMLDVSGNNNTGKITSSVLLAQPGYSGSSYYFSGKNSLVTVPNSSSLNPGTGSFSIAMRFKSTVKPTSSVGDYDLARKGLSTTSGGDWKMEILQSGKLFCLFKGSTRQVQLTGTTDVVNGAWHLLECRSTASGTALVVDGVTQRQTSSRSGNISNSSSVTIGAKNSSEDQTTGYIDQVIIQKGNF